MSKRDKEVIDKLTTMMGYVLIKPSLNTSDTFLMCNMYDKKFGNLFFVTVSFKRKLAQIQMLSALQVLKSSDISDMIFGC